MSIGLGHPNPGDKPSNAPEHHVLQFVGFRLEDTDYAIPITRIREILLMRPITRVPQVPDYVEGLFNLRGMIIPIISLRKRFDLPKRENDEETRTIVVNVGDKTCGLIVDAVTQVLRIFAGQIQPPPPAVSEGIRRFISGLAKIDDRLLIILDMDRVFETEGIPAPFPQTHS